jgi:tetratricopeptide (TPR) repeat protein
MLGLIFWPWALQNPINNPYKALKVMTHYLVAVRQLFEGSNVFSNSLPWYYVPKYILISVPLVVLAGLIPFLLFVRNKMYSKLFVLFSFLFPLFYVVVSKSNLYGGWRHLLFVFPFLVILSVWGYSCLFHHLGRKLKLITSLLICTGVIINVGWEVKNYPHFLPYYNQLVGGVEGAYGNYELDYYYSSLLPASQKLLKSEKFRNKNGKIIIASDHPKILRYYFKEYENVKIVYSRFYDKSSKYWDFAIFQNAYISAHQLKKGYFPPFGLICSEKVDGKDIAVVLERLTYDDYLGVVAMKNKQYIKALKYFQAYLLQNKHSEEIYECSARCFGAINKNSSAIQCAKSSLLLYPDFPEALHTLSKLYFNNGNYKLAIQTSIKLTRIKATHWESYYVIGLSHMKLDNYEKAIKALKLFIANVKNNKDACYILATIFKKNGDVENANKYFYLSGKVRSNAN